MGPEKHCVFYPVRAGTEFNLVLLRPDNLPANTRTVQGDIGEMRATFDAALKVTDRRIVRGRAIDEQRRLLILSARVPRGERECAKHGERAEAPISPRELFRDQPAD